MARDLHSEMAAAARSLAQTGRIATISQRKLSSIFAIVFSSPPPESGEANSPQTGRRERKRPRSEIDKNYRISKARTVYKKALQRGSCYFIVFGLCVTATDCRDPETALFPEQDERAPNIQFYLHKETLALFRSWARFNRYHANEDFVNFIEQLLESPAGDEGMAPEPDIFTESNFATEVVVERDPAMNDFDIVARIIKDRGLSGNATVREAMRIIFPEHAYRTWPLRFGLAPMIDTQESTE